VAVFPPAAEVDALRRAFPDDAALTRPSGWHVTLVFLGDVAELPVAEVLDSLPAPGRFGLRLAGGGQFGQVAWAGLLGDISVLGAFRERMRIDLAAAGFPSDERPFRPHLTVSYRSDPSVRAALARHAGASWTVESFALVSSVGGEYEPIRTWPTGLRSRGS
jgi:2'-5' RNA ligase